MNIHLSRNYSRRATSQKQPKENSLLSKEVNAITNSSGEEQKFRFNKMDLELLNLT